MVALTRFVDRVDAGQRLGIALHSFAPESPLVLGLARGGVPVAAQVARALDAPLDVLLVRKLGVPDQRELAFGAIGEVARKFSVSNSFAGSTLATARWPPLKSANASSWSVVSRATERDTHPSHSSDAP